MLAKQEQKHIGRPSIYTPELARNVCHIISTHTQSLKELRAMYGIPSATAIHEWLVEREEFALMYARARMSQAQLFAEEVIQISDDISNDTVIDEDGNKRCNNEWIARSRLRVDSRKWLASKLLPRVYGDKVQSEVTIVVKHEDALGALE